MESSPAPGQVLPITLVRGGADNAARAREANAAFKACKLNVEWAINHHLRRIGGDGAATIVKSAEELLSPLNDLVQFTNLLALSIEEGGAL